MLLQIHDSLLYECDPTALVDAVELVKTEMQRPVTINSHEVSFSVDLETGPDWGSMVAYG